MCRVELFLRLQSHHSFPGTRLTVVSTVAGEDFGMAGDRQRGKRRRAADQRSVFWAACWLDFFGSPTKNDETSDGPAGAARALNGDERRCSSCGHTQLLLGLSPSVY